MIVKPRIKGFICTTAHPVGCEKSVQLQAEYAKGNPIKDMPKRVLVIGASGGYGLASRITACFAGGADTIGVHFDKEPSEKRTGSAGYYTTKAFDALAKKEGRISCSINGDAFSPDVKRQVIEAIKTLPGQQVDCVIYSLAAPRKTDSDTGKVYRSVIKPIDQSFEERTIDVNTGVVSMVKVEPASAEEIEDTVAVMGGSDWKDWIELLLENRMLAEDAHTVAYSYIGPSQTHSIYTNGTIGRAKADLDKTAKELGEIMESIKGRAYVSVNKALVTQASSAIPVVPLYIALMYRVMKEKGVHEGCIQQTQRLFARLYSEPVLVDEQGRIRLDDFEMKDEVQNQIKELWEQVTSENINEIGDMQGYREDFLNIFGFDIPGVDYEADVDIQ
ncbi:enoyl-[acyl-carrier protein] reductase/trans-2-enoyl-CoA reductase (NAD+) [Aequitasia blattaphilus]|uniref:Trans-2-enoyl-CoA reductase [NADH] n=1 Tax=Aequitasia blattaphilus TaxID=2949332 RepID=A0ABT1E7L7_9FIRM|nr:enoyl-ACP reductase FabV [Aequitasia blattaphilus]MCP1101832.1 trans-2-enoyl-CoA reductase family protein [Aequitasia blattaphilus]MCR8614472.1 trans-2-enoyl-CoA reductase family protein [Aequitasia blattaphilus]